ncbi:MAG: 2-succinyl-6-hydroxy-2,4-cyclohexadiene-1-carboxylate synthase [Deltaproteobacteria bacterium]|nr:2-succinyl-6-hydroxy-2,4-cyclohexadiene-1-carboxylate synthase [Deltaproteobacteria bacterium]
MTDYLETKVDAHGCSFQIRIEGGGPPLLLLHGFTGSIETMAPLATTLRNQFSVISVDLPGHGRTFLFKDGGSYDFSDCVRGLGGILDQLNIDKCFICGYSMGGRTALLFAVRYPFRVSALAAIGASGGIEEREERIKRRKDDEALACSLESGGIEQFTQRWMNHPLFAGQQKLGKEFLAAARRQRLQNDPFSLAFSLRTMGTGSQKPLYQSLGQLDIPMMFLAGEEDRKFYDLAVKLQKSCARGYSRFIRKSGHAAHLENLAMTAETLALFFNRYTTEEMQSSDPVNIEILSQQ